MLRPRLNKEGFNIMGKDEQTEVAPSTQSSDRALIKEALRQLGPEYSKENKIEAGRLLVKVIEKGIPLKEVMQVGEKDVAMIFLSAFDYFSGGKYFEAKLLFKALLVLTPDDPNVAIGLGVCCQRLKEYEEAIVYYMLGAMLAPGDPTPFYYTYACYMELNNHFCACAALYNVINRCGDDAKYSHMKQKSMLLIQDIEKEIKQRSPVVDKSLSA